MNNNPHCGSFLKQKANILMLIELSHLCIELPLAFAFHLKRLWMKAFSPFLY